MADATIREVFDRCTQAFNAHDMDSFEETMADDVIVIAPGVRIEGKAAAVHFYRGWIQAFSDARVTIAKVHILDDVAIEEGVFTGTHDGVLQSPTGDLPPTGRAVTLGYIDVWRFRNARTASFNLMFDRLALLEQLGVAPAAQATAAR